LLKIHIYVFNLSLTKHIAIDCQYVGVGPAGEKSELARVAVVNYFGNCVYDSFVKPVSWVTDYRSVTPKDLKSGIFLVFLYQKEYNLLSFFKLYLL
jgi:RNA exonuclease 4